MAGTAFSATMTLVAAAVLAFDGAALAFLGWASGRGMLAFVGLTFFVSSGLVLLHWRRYRRRLEDLASARRDLGEEVEEMRRLLKSKP